MKKTNLIRLLVLMMVLITGVTQVFAWDASSANIYYDNTSSGWSDVQILIGKEKTNDNYSSVEGMTKLTNSNNLYYKRSLSWGGATEFYFVTGCSNWGGEGNTPTHRKSWAGGYSAKLTNNLSNSTWLFISSGSSNGSSVSGSTVSSYDNLNYTQTVQQKLSTDGGSTYSTSTTSLATVKVASYYLSSASSTSATATDGTISSGNSSANCKAVRTATVTYTVSSVATGYTFVGWYDGNTQKSTSNTYTYNATEAKTITARFKENQYSLTFSHNGHGSIAVAGNTVSSGSTANVNYYTTKTLVASPADGYHFTGWTLSGTNTGSVTIGNAANASTTIKATNTGATVTAGFAADASNYTITYGVGTSYTSYGSVSEGHSYASGSSQTSGTEISLTATPVNSHYKLEGWYTNAACTTAVAGAGTTNPYVFSLGANTSVYAKFVLKTCSITLDRNGGSSGSTSVTATHGSTLPSFTAHGRTGYTLKGYYTDTSGGTKIINEDGTLVQNTTYSTNTNPAKWNSDATSLTLHAQWTENMTTVTINVSPASSGTLTVGGAAFTPGNTTTAGVSTSRTVVATAANSDYTFNNWTKTGNAAGSASTNTYTLKGNGSGSTGTLTANFNLVECKLLYGSSTPLNSPTDGGAMSYDATEHAYYKDVTTNSSPYYFQFGIGSIKYANGAWDTYPNVQEATANGAKIDCKDDVSGWDNKASIKFTGTSGSSIRIWFDQQNKKAWITETGYSVTINNGDHGTVSPNGSQTVGASGITIKATPEEGYKLSSWTVTGGAHVASSTSATTTLTATADGTVTAIYETESPIRLYYSNPAGWSNVYAYLWDVDNTSDKNANWPGTDITTNIELVDCQQFYYYEYYPSAHAGWDRIIFNGGDGSKQTHDLPFSAATNAGQYQNAGKDEDGSWQDPTNPWYFAYDGDSWSTTAHPLTCTSATSGYVELDLAANTDYAFKFIENGSTWYGCTTPTKITYENKATAQTMNNTAGGSADQTIKTAGAGTYRFTWDITNKRVTVTYPTSYKVELEVGTVKGNKNTLKIYHTSTTAGNEVTSGNYVAAGTKVYFWAATSASEATICKAGYTWWGFYNNASGTGSDLPEKYTTAEVSMFNVNPITSDMHVYAVFGEKDYWITPYINGQGSISPNGANAHIATPTEFTANPGTGYKFDSWEERDGSAMTIATPSVATTNVTTSAAATLQANFSPRWSVIGTGAFGGWTAYDAHKFDGYNVVSSKDVGYNTITLAANTTYEIKTYDRETSTFYGGSVNQDIDYAHSGSDNEYTIATTADPKSVFIHSAAAGSYTLNWNLTDKKIAVVYPTSRYITTGQKTVGQDDSNGGSFTAVDNSSNDVYGGKFVANNANVVFTATPNTGYNFVGWYSDASCETAYVNGTGGAAISGEGGVVLTLSSITADKTVYAKFTPKNYNVALDMQSGAEGYGSGSNRNETVTYNTTLTTVGSLPTAANGYAFMGFYSAEGGKGTPFINASGTWATSVPDTIADSKWVLDAGATLYAYFKKAEITAITLNSSILDPVDAGEGWVIANPTIAPTPEGTTKICWELLYDNDNLVPSGHDAKAYTEGDTKPNQVRFSITGLAASRYKIKATLRTGSSCDGGDELSTRTQTFTIASSFTVNILYQDDDNNNIAPGTTSPGKATDWTTISAPDIFGYSFVGWNLGEGITTEDPTDKQNDFRFKASYYGTIVAQYTKNQYIYLDLSQTFSTYGKWNNPYVYFYNGDPWVDNKGAGAKDGDKTHTHYISGHAMTKIDGTDIWYFDYGGVSGATRYVAFTWGDKTMQENFNATDVIFRGDFSESTPLFVPATDGTAESRKTDVNGAQYYNKGYWVTYLGEPTGYTLLVYNSAGDVQLKSEPFIAADKRMTMTSTVELDASSTYKIEVLRNDGYWYKAASNFTASSLGPKPILPDGTKNAIQTNADGIYTFTLGYNSGNLQLSVVYPSSIGDFRIAYTDNATWSHSHTLESWILPSKAITHRANGIDTVSFFISKGDGITPKIRWQKVTGVSTSSVTWGTTVGTDCGAWLTTGYTDVSEAGVYNFKVTQNADGTSIASIERIGEYDGSYYIRCNALRSKWDHYTIDSDHRMTYSEFSESAANSFGEKYSHYKAKWCPRNTNIAFVIANDYSPCLTDKLTQDVGGPAFNNLEADGTLKYEKTGGGDMKYDDASAYLDKYSANVRFMWNRKTNKISRAYVSAATSNNAKFLVLQGSGTSNSNIYNGTTGSAFTADPPGANSVILKDDQNWIYEEVIKANPSALVKLYANYCDQTQWFRGADGTPFEKNVNAIELLGGSPSSSKYAVRVIYDFKTNRLVCAWMPEGASQEIETNLTVNADVMVIREHQGSAQCITFANDKSMTGVKTVYGAMKFNRWILSNRAHPEDTNPDHCRESNLGADLANFHPVLPIGQQLSIYERSLYFISFPFNVKASEIFGFGHYWDEWYLEYYDGETRAKNGYWKDSPPNWKYVTPDMLEDFTLMANEGYILGLDLDFMQVDNTAFWSNGISTVELYFPSTVNLETLKQTNVTIPALSSDYKCTINRGTPEGDRRVKDSYWRCLGVPSFNIYNSALKDGSGNTIEWKTDYTWHADESEFPFIYMWNKADNTLTPQATSTFTFLPMHAYLVQNGGEINWTAVSAKPSSIVARRVNEQPQKEYNWDLTLVCDSQLIDRTYIRMSNLEQVTDTFDFGQDLNKEFNKTRSNIYTFIGYEQVAANSMPMQTEQTTIVSVGVNILSAGDYTFAMPEGTMGVGITLIDTETGVRTNLGLMDYTVTLTKGDYTNRFLLEIPAVSNVATDIELINGENGDASLNGVRKVLIDNKLFLIKDGEVYDARGAKVK